MLKYKITGQVVHNSLQLIKEITNNQAICLPLNRIFHYGTGNLFNAGHSTEERA
jgi:hypothetical protein